MVNRISKAVLLACLMAVGANGMAMCGKNNDESRRELRELQEKWLNRKVREGLAVSIGVLASGLCLYTKFVTEHRLYPERNLKSFFKRGLWKATAYSSLIPAYLINRNEFFPDFYLFNQKLKDKYFWSWIPEQNPSEKK
ncbi:MAG: hypothetical protein H6679_03120 [Epsilonproteobacteria bacterium]|nr:hypothetical protein [Campylobacterota bacterium]